MILNSDSGVLEAEGPYQFRRALTTVHEPGRRDPLAIVGDTEIVIDESWVITVPQGASQLVRHAADDLRDYFATSMDLSLRVVQADTIDPYRPFAISLALDESLPSRARGYQFSVSDDRVSIQGVDERGTAQGSYYLEDLLNLRGAPFLTPQLQLREPLMRPRMTHSGYGVDEFPDAHLERIAHAGFDSILLFAQGPDRVPAGHSTSDAAGRNGGRYMSFEGVAQRCGAHGLDLYLYAHVRADRGFHPDDPDAAELFDRNYGSLFAACPSAKGIILVGESIEFPSKDPRTTGRLRLDPDPRNLPDDRPTPGWWPCDDYPQWVAGVRDACRAYNPDAEIVLWTYNWGWAPEADRLRLIRELPDDIIVQSTFEMFEKMEHDGVTNVCIDYTLANIGPGGYFASEARAAHERGLTLYSMTNTSGLTWDFGSIGYQPTPFRWLERHRAVLAARESWNLSGIMENHHYGWFPSVVSELAKWMYWTPSPAGEDILSSIARRDFGAGADFVLEAWREWGVASEHYVPTVADQYGPCRIGPSYPFTLSTVPSLVVAPHAMFGTVIVDTPYEPEQTGSVPTTAPALRIPGEVASMQRMLTHWQAGNLAMTKAMRAVPVESRLKAAAMENLGRYIAHCIETTLNAKHWWQTRSLLQVETNREASIALLDALAQLGEKEILNATAAIECVQSDSRLGWEPSMDYLGDEEHIRWKLAHLRAVLDHELPAFRQTLTI